VQLGRLRSGPRAKPALTIYCGHNVGSDGTRAVDYFIAGTSRRKKGFVVPIRTMALSAEMEQSMFIGQVTNLVLAIHRLDFL
jgi:hypothetical protein